jgi:hypothetical protein
MSKQSTVSITVTVIGDGLPAPPNGPSYTPPGTPIVNAAAPCAAPAVPIALTAGANTVAVPAGSKALVLTPPTNSTNEKWAGAQTTGWKLHPALTSVLTIADGVTTVAIWSAGSESCAAAWT